MPALSVIGSAVCGFRILSPLGVGAMGAVYLAEHPLLGRRVAVKILHPQRAQNAEAVGLFVAEMRAAQSLRHRGIVQVLDMSMVETAAGELPCIVMELLDGRTLGEVLADDGAMAPAVAVVVAEQIAEVLTDAHERGIVHRDLKPENVFISRTGRGLPEIKVLDFGIARLGLVHGTPAYLAPEQCLGFTGDEATDIYALGVMLFEMLTGRTPYFRGVGGRRRGVGDMVIAHIASTPRRPSQVKPGVPASLDAIVARALEKDPSRRFRSMAEMLQALRDPSAFLEPPVAVELPAPRPEPVPEPAPAPAAIVTAPPATDRSRAPRMAVPLAAAAATLLALLGVLAGGATRAENVGQPAAAATASTESIRLTVTSCAAGARVYFDGVDVGPAGGSWMVPSGRPIDLSVRAPRFITWDRRVSPVADERIEVVLLPHVEATKPEA